MRPDVVMRCGISILLCSGLLLGALAARACPPYNASRHTEDDPTLTPEQARLFSLVRISYWESYVEGSPSVALPEAWEAGTPVCIRYQARQMFFVNVQGRRHDYVSVNTSDHGETFRSSMERALQPYTNALDIHVAVVPTQLNIQIRTVESDPQLVLRAPIPVWSLVDPGITDFFRDENKLFGRFTSSRDVSSTVREQVDVLWRAGTPLVFELAAEPPDLSKTPWLWQGYAKMRSSV